MSRDPNPTLKPALLEKVLVYLLEHGLADLSLRPLAKAAGTTARMLIYHFESKEQLIVAALSLMQDKQLAALGDSPPPQTSSKAELKYLWQWFSSPSFLPFVKLLFEIEAQAMNDNALYTDFSKQTLTGWVAFVQSRFADYDKTKATLIVNVFSGLLLDLLVTHDTERVTRSFEAFATLLEKGE